MSINILFAIIGGAALVGAIGLIVAVSKLDKSLIDKPGLRALTHLGVMVFLALGIAFLTLSGIAHNCPNCNTVVRGNYCNECGYQVRTIEYPQKLFCSECGADINTNANFCGCCGKEARE